MPLNPNMSDSSRKAIQVLTGIEVPTASPPAMRAAAEIYDGLSVRLSEDLTALMNTVRARVRRNFGGRTSEFYDRSLNQFTQGENDYLGSAAAISRSLSVELRKGAANAEYMSAMVLVQFAQLLAEIAWAIATAKFTFGATLKYIPIFKMIRSLAMQRILAWFLITVPGHQIVSQLFASMDSVIQRIQIANGTRDTWDHDLTKGAHVGAVMEGLVSAGLSGALGAVFDKQIANLLTNRIDLLRTLPDPVPVPPVGKGVPDPVPPPPPLRGIDDTVPAPSGTGRPDPVPVSPPDPPPPRPDVPPARPDADVPPPPPGGGRPDPDPVPRPDPTPGPRPEPAPVGGPVPVPGGGSGGGAAGRGLNRDLADVFSRHRDEMAAPFGSNAPPGATAWNNAANRARFREDMAGVFERNFGASLGADQARRLGSDYADTLVRTWNTPDAGAQLTRTLGDHLPPPVRDHLARLPQDMLEPVYRHFQSKGAWAARLGAGGASGAAEGYLGEGLGNAAMGEGFKASAYSATSGASMNTVQQVSTDGALAGIDALSGPPKPPVPEVPPPGEDARSGVERVDDPAPDAVPSRSADGAGADRPSEPGSGPGRGGADVVVDVDRRSDRPDDPDSDGGGTGVRGGDSRAEEGGGDEYVRPPSRPRDEPTAPPETGGPARAPEQPVPSPRTEGEAPEIRPSDSRDRREDSPAPGSGDLPGDIREAPGEGRGTSGQGEGAGHRPDSRTGDDREAQGRNEDSGGAATRPPGSPGDDTRQTPADSGNAQDQHQDTPLGGGDRTPASGEGGGRETAPPLPGTNGAGRTGQADEGLGGPPVAPPPVLAGTDRGAPQPSTGQGGQNNPSGDGRTPRTGADTGSGARSGGEDRAPAPAAPDAPAEPGPGAPGDERFEVPPTSTAAPEAALRDGTPPPPTERAEDRGTQAPPPASDDVPVPPPTEGAGGRDDAQNSSGPDDGRHDTPLPDDRNEPQGARETDGADRDDAPGPDGGRRDALSSDDRSASTREADGDSGRDRRAVPDGPPPAYSFEAQLNPGLGATDVPGPPHADPAEAVSDDSGRSDADSVFSEGAESVRTGDEGLFDDTEHDEAPPAYEDERSGPPAYPYSDLADAPGAKGAKPPVPSPSVAGDLKWLLNPHTVLPPPLPTAIQVFTAEVPLVRLDKNGRPIPPGSEPAADGDEAPGRSAESGDPADGTTTGNEGKAPAAGDAPARGGTPRPAPVQESASRDAEDTPAPAAGKGKAPAVEDTPAPGGTSAGDKGRTPATEDGSGPQRDDSAATPPEDKAAAVEDTSIPGETTRPGPVQEGTSRDAENAPAPRTEDTSAPQRDHASDDTSDDDTPAPPKDKGKAPAVEDTSARDTSAAPPPRDKGKAPATEDTSAPQRDHSSDDTSDDATPAPPKDKGKAPERHPAPLGLDYLVSSRFVDLNGVHVDTARVRAAIADSVNAQSVRVPRAVREQALAHFEGELGRGSGARAFFGRDGAGHTVRHGSDAWHFRVRLSGDHGGGYRHATVTADGEVRTPTVRTDGATHEGKDGGSSSQGTRKGLSAKFNVNPLFLSATPDGWAFGPVLSAGGSAGLGLRTMTFGGSDKGSTALEVKGKGAPEVYTADLRVDVDVTPPPGAAPLPVDGPRPRPPAPAVVPRGVALVVPGEVRPRPSGAPDRMSFRPGRDGPGAAGGPAPRRPRLEHGGLPITVSAITPKTGKAYTDLGSWLADRLLPPRTDGNGRPATGKRADAERAWREEFAKKLDNDSIRQYLPAMDQGPIRISAVLPDGRERVVHISSPAMDYRAKEHSPRVDEFVRHDGAEESRSSDQGRTSKAGFTLGGGFGIEIRLPAGRIRVDAPVAEYGYTRTWSSQTQKSSKSGTRDTFAMATSDTDDFLAYSVSRDLVVRLDGETERHEFTGDTVELLSLRDARTLDAAAKGLPNPHTGTRPDAPAPPFGHLRGDRITKFHGARLDGFSWPEPSGGDTPAAGRDTAADQVPVTERLIQEVLTGLARELPGIVVPELSRTKDDYARRPGREKASYFDRSPREHRGLRRNLRVARRNTERVERMLRQEFLDNHGETLASRDGLAIHLDEKAVIDLGRIARGREAHRPGMVTVRVKAQFGALTHQGSKDGRTGIHVGGSAKLGSDQGKGATHSGSLTAGPGLARGNAEDARGMAKIMGSGGLAASIARAWNSGRSHGTEHRSDQLLLFPDGSDTWSGRVVLDARLHEYDAAEQVKGTDESVPLLSGPIVADYSLVTPKMLTGPAATAPRASDGEVRPLSTDDARRLVQGALAPPPAAPAVSGDGGGRGSDGTRTDGEGTRTDGRQDGTGDGRTDRRQNNDGTRTEGRTGDTSNSARTDGRQDGTGDRRTDGDGRQNDTGGTRTDRRQDGDGRTDTRRADGDGRQDGDTERTDGQRTGDGDRSPGPDRGRQAEREQARRARALIDNGVVEHVNNDLGNGDLGGQARRLLTEPVSPLQISAGRKLLHFLDTRGGRSFFERLFSPTGMAGDPATFSPGGQRDAVDMTGGLLSPNDGRADLVTKAEPDRVTQLQLTRIQPVLHAETSVDAGTVHGVTYSGSARVGANTGGSTNPDKAHADGPEDLTPAAARGPIPLTGLSDTWAFLRRGRTAETRATFTSSLTIVPKAALGYAFQVGGTVTQAVELMKGWGLAVPGLWSTRYRGWRAALSDLASGYISARDARRAGVVADRLRENADGTLEEGSQPEPETVGGIRVREGFEHTGQRVRPADPTAALESLVRQLDAKGYELTRSSRKRLFDRLTTQLGKSSGTNAPVAVRVRRKGAPFGHASSPGTVRVDLRTTDPRVEYLASTDEIVESHTWKSEGVRSRSRGGGNTVGVEHVHLVPAHFEGQDRGPDDQPGHRPLFTTPAGSTGHTTSQDTTHSDTVERTRTAQLETAGPYAKVVQQGTLELSMEFDVPTTASRGEVHVPFTDRTVVTLDARGDAGTIQTLYPYAYLDFSGAGAPRTESGTDAGPATGTGAPGGDRRIDDGAADGHPDLASAMDGRTAPRYTAGEATAFDEGVVIMPTAVGGHGDHVRDTAVVTIAKALGWTPEPGDRADGVYSARDISSARAHMAAELGLDPRYTPVDSALDAIALKSLFSEAAGVTEGVPLTRIGALDWRLGVAPDLRGARVLEVLPESRLSWKDGEEHASGDGLGHSAGAIAEGGFRPTGLNTEHPSFDDHAAVMTGAPNVSAVSPVSTAVDGSGSRTDTPPSGERESRGPVYLIEFDTTWTVGARSDRGPSFLKRPAHQHIGDTRGRMSAWVSQKDAIRLGIVTEDHARGLAAKAEEARAAAEAMARDELAYDEARGGLADPVAAYREAHAAHLAERAADGASKASGEAAERLGRAREAYLEQEAKAEAGRKSYEKSTRSWVAAVSSSRRAFDSPEALFESRVEQERATAESLRERGERVRARIGSASEDADRTRAVLDAHAPDRGGLLDRDGLETRHGQVRDLRSNVEAFLNDLGDPSAPHTRSADEETALRNRRDALLDQVERLLTDARDRRARLAGAADRARTTVEKALDLAESSRSGADRAHGELTDLRTARANAEAEHGRLVEDARGTARGRTPAAEGAAGSSRPDARLDTSGRTLEALGNTARTLGEGNDALRSRVADLLSRAESLAREELIPSRDQGRFHQELERTLTGLGERLVDAAAAEVERDAAPVGGELGRRAHGAALDEAARLLDGHASAHSPLPPRAAGFTTPEQVTGLAGRVAEFERALRDFAARPDRSPAEVADMERRRRALVDEAAGLAAPVAERAGEVAPRLDSGRTAAAAAAARTGPVRAAVDGADARIRDLNARISEIARRSDAFSGDGTSRDSLDRARTALTDLGNLRDALAGRLGGPEARHRSLTGTEIPALEREAAHLDGLRSGLDDLRTRLDGAAVPGPAARGDDGDDAPAPGGSRGDGGGASRRPDTGTGPAGERGGTPPPGDGRGSGSRGGRETADGTADVSRVPVSASRDTGAGGVPPADRSPDPADRGVEAAGASGERSADLFDGTDGVPPAYGAEPSPPPYPYTELLDRILSGGDGKGSKGAPGPVAAGEPKWLTDPLAAPPPTEVQVFMADIPLGPLGPDGRAPAGGTAGEGSGADRAPDGDPDDSGSDEDTTPYVSDGSLNADRTGEAHDLDYLVGSRMVGPGRLRTDGVPDAIERSLRGMRPRMPRELREQVLAEVERIAGERGMDPFFTPGGQEVAVGSGGDAWKVRVRLAADRPAPDTPPAYRHVPIRRGKGTDAAVIEGQERTRTVSSGDTVTRGARRGLNLKFTANPLYFGPTFLGDPVGPSFTAGVSGGTGLRSAATGGTAASSAVQAMDNSGPAEVYTADLRMDLDVTPPSGPPAHAPRPAVVRDGMALILSGKAEKRPEGAPAHISLARPPAGGPAPRTLHGGLPIKIERIVPPGGPAGARPTHTDLGSWLADRLVPEDTGSDLHRTIRALFDNDSLQEYLPHLSRGPLTLKVSRGDGTSRMVRLASSAHEYRAFGHAPHLGELTRHDGSEHTVSSSRGRGRTVGFSVGGGVNIELSLPGGGMTRIDVPTLEYAYSRTLDSRTHTSSRSGSRRMIARDIADTEDFLAYRVERDLSVHIEGEPEPHAFTGETVEIVSRRDAEALRDASGAGPRRGTPDEHPRPPLAHLRGDTVTDLGGTTVLGFDHPEPDAGAAPGDGPTVYERLQQEVLDAVARRHPGMVIPDMARNRADYALRPGNEGASFGEKKWREVHGLRRNYDVARENTLRILDALAPHSLHAGDRELTSERGLPVHLTENAAVDPSLMARGEEVLRPDSVTVHVHAAFGRLEFDGRTPTETGVRLGGGARSGAGRGKGSSHTLGLTAGAGLLRSREADARGMGHRMGGASASLSGSRSRSSDTSHGVSHTSDDTVFFPGGSDIWRGRVELTARISEYEGSDLARGTDQSEDLLTAPVRADYRVITPHVLTEGSQPERRTASPGPEELSSAQARALIEGPFSATGTGGAAPARDGETPEQARERRRAEDVVRAGGLVERVDVGPVSRTFELFSGFRRGPFQGFERKLRTYLNTTGGRTYFQELLSSTGMADDPSTTSPGGRRGRSDLGGGVLSPGDLRATVATRVEPERISELQQVEMQMIAHGETGVEIGASDTVTTSAGVRVGGSAGGTGNRIVDEAAQRDPATAVPPRDAVGPTPVGGLNDTWNFFRSGRGTSARASFVSSTTIVPKAALGYAFRLGGRAVQAVELAHSRGVVAPVAWRTRFRGWAERIHDLVSGYISARDAQEAGIVLDRVTEDGEGGIELSPQDDPADITGVRVRPGFEDAGRRVRPADPTAALETMVRRLRAQGYELTGDSRESLFEALTTRLGNTSGTSEPVRVRVRRTSGSGEPRSGHRARDARVYVELRAKESKVEYVASGDAVIESHTWTAAEGSSRSTGTGNTVGGEGVPLQPTPFQGDGNPPGQEPDSRPLFAAPAVSGGVSSSGTDTRSGSVERTHTVQLETGGPYAKVEQDGDLVLTLRGPDGLEVGAQEPSGPIHTLYPYSYLDFSPRTEGSGTGAPAAGAGRGRTSDAGGRPPTAGIEDGAAARGRDLTGALADRARALFTGGRATRVPEGTVMMPVAVEGGGHGVRDTAAVVIAGSLGWRPGAGDRDGTGGYTAEGVERARDFTARKLHLDHHRSPVDGGLESIALKALFSRTAGHEEGVALMDLGSTSWRLTALPDLSGARILDVVAGSRLSTTTEEKRSLSESSAHASGTALDPSLRPSGLTTDKDVYDKHTGVLVGSATAPLGTNTGTAADGRGAATAGPPLSRTQRLGPAYLVEFDTTWIVGASSGGGGVHSGQTRGTVAAWVARSDALRLGLVTPEQAGRLDAEAERVRDAADLMGEQEQDYGRERGRLEEPVRDYLRAHEAHRVWLADRTTGSEDGSRSGSSETADWAADRLQEARDAYRAQEGRYRESLRRYEEGTRAWVDTLNGARRDFLAAGRGADAGAPASAAPAGVRTGAPVLSDTALRDTVADELDARDGAPDTAGPDADLRRKLTRLDDTVADLRERSGHAHTENTKAAELLTRLEDLLADHRARTAAPPPGAATAPARAADLRTRIEAFRRDLDRMAARDDQDPDAVAALDARRDALLAQARALHAEAEGRRALFAGQARDTRAVLDRVLDRVRRPGDLLDGARDRIRRVRAQALHGESLHRPLARDARDPGHAAVRGDVRRLGDGLREVREAARGLSDANDAVRTRIDRIMSDADTIARRDLPRMVEGARLPDELAAMGRPLVDDVLADLRGEVDGAREVFDRAPAPTPLGEAERLLGERAAPVPPPDPGLATPGRVSALDTRVAALERDVAAFAARSVRGEDEAAALRERHRTLVEETDGLLGPVGDRGRFVSAELDASRDAAVRAGAHSRPFRRLLDGARRELGGLRARVDGVAAEYGAFVGSDGPTRADLTGLRADLDGLDGRREALETRVAAVEAGVGALTRTRIPGLAAEVEALRPLNRDLRDLERRLDGLTVPEAAPRGEDGSDDSGDSDSEDDGAPPPGAGRGGGGRGLRSAATGRGGRTAPGSGRDGARGSRSAPAPTGAGAEDAAPGASLREAGSGPQRTPHTSDDVPATSSPEEGTGPTAQAPNTPEGPGAAQQRSSTPDDVPVTSSPESGAAPHRVPDVFDEAADPREAPPAYGAEQAPPPYPYAELLDRLRGAKDPAAPGPGGVKGLPEPPAAGAGDLSVFSALVPDSDPDGPPTLSDAFAEALNPTLAGPYSPTGSDQDMLDVHRRYATGAAPAPAADGGGAAAADDTGSPDWDAYVDLPDGPGDAAPSPAAGVGSDGDVSMEDASDGGTSDGSGSEGAPPPVPGDPSTYPGHLDGAGVRRFADADEADAYGDLILRDPDLAGPPYHRLPGDRRHAVFTYTASSWVNVVARAGDRATARTVLEEWADATRDAAAAGDPDSEGWDLYELNDRTAPSLDDLRAARHRPDLTPRQRRLVEGVLAAPDPGAALREVLERSGESGAMADLNGGRYPRLEDAERLMALLDSAIGQRLPEATVAVRTLHTMDHLAGYDPRDPRGVIGRVQEDAGHMSAALGDEPAVVGDEPDPVRIHLLLPAGTRFLWVGNASLYPDQREILLPRRVRYVVRRVRVEGGETVLYAEVLPPSAPGADG